MEENKIDIGLGDWQTAENQSGEMNDWEKNKIITGCLQEIRENVGENNSTIYSVKQDDGNLVSFWSTTVLFNKMQKLSLGDIVKVEYLGEKKGKSGRKYKDFDVKFKKSN